MYYIYHVEFNEKMNEVKRNTCLEESFDITFLENGFGGQTIIFL